MRASEKAWRSRGASAAPASTPAWAATTAPTTDQAGRSWFL